GANIHNGGLLGAVTSLTLGPVVVSVINATGAVTTLTAADVTSSVFTAGSFGTVKTTGSSTLGLAGNFASPTLLATGNVAGVALKSLSIAGDLGSSSLIFQDGDVTSITVSRTANASTINAVRGALKAITAGRWTSTNVDARSIGSLKVIGNLTAGLFGDFTRSQVTPPNKAPGVGPATFSAPGPGPPSPLHRRERDPTTFTVGRQLGSTTVKLTDPAFGALGTIQAGDWTSNVIVLAKTITTVASVGAAAVNPASPLLLGGINTDTITAYLATGTGVAIG